MRAVMLAAAAALALSSGAALAATGGNSGGGNGGTPPANPSVTTQGSTNAVGTNQNTASNVPTASAPSTSKESPPTAASNGAVTTSKP